MHLTGKLTKWNADKAFGFIAPNGGGDDVFIHKTAFANKQRTPQINDTISFDVVKEKDGRYKAVRATYAGEKKVSRQTKHSTATAKDSGKFSLYLSLIFMLLVLVGVVIGYLPTNMLNLYVGLSVITFLMYAIDKIKAQRDAWRTKESTLHILALIGGWPGAALAQQLLRHKSSKKEFRQAFWATVILNLAVFGWLSSPLGNKYLPIFG